MITLKNQLVLQFNLGDKFIDFLNIDNFRSMKIIENCGGLKPVLTISFVLQDLNILPYVNQGNIISIRYGVTQLNENSMQFIITGDNKTQQLKTGSQITLVTAMYNPEFDSKNGSQTITGKSYEVLNEICKQSKLKFNTNVTKTNDRQIWTQDGKTLRQFTDYISNRAYKDDSTFFNYAFDCNNLYFYDVKDLLANGAKWYLTCGSTGQDENAAVVNIGTYIPDSSMLGTMTQLAGKNVETIGYNLDTGEFIYPKHKLKTFTTIGTNNVNINATNCQSYNYMITTGSEHENTIAALNQNKRNQALFSSFTVRVPIPGQYRDFRLMDVVQLIPNEKDSECEGIYLITGIVREIKDNVYSTNLTLNRESANNIKGNLVQGEK